MEKNNVSQEEIRSLAGVVLHKTNLLIHLCDKILPEEEGVKNVFRRFAEREKTERKKKLANLKNRVTGFIKNKKIFIN